MTPATDPNRRGDWNPNLPMDKTSAVQQRGRLIVYGGAALIVTIFGGAILFALTTPVSKLPVRPLEQGVDLGAVLAPIIAASLAIERIIEMAWNLVETYIRSFVAFLAGRSEWLRWAKDELIAARARLAALAEEGDPTRRVGDLLSTSEDALTQLIERAANDVAYAEQRLASLTATPQYRDAKRIISIITSLVLGIVISGAAGLQMLALLGINVNERIDILFTGLVIGTGSTPVHSFIGILQQSKDTLEGIQKQFKLRNVEKSQDLATKL